MGRLEYMSYRNTKRSATLPLAFRHGWVEHVRPVLVFLCLSGLQITCRFASVTAAHYALY